MEEKESVRYSGEVVVTTQVVKSEGDPAQRGPRSLDGDRDWSTKLFACREDTKVCECLYNVYRKIIITATIIRRRNA